MILDLTPRQASALFGAMRTVATAGDTTVLSDTAAGAITSLAASGIGCDPPDLAALPGAAPDQLAASLGDPAQVATATEILAIMALVDGTLDAGRIDQVLAFAQAMSVHDNWLDDLAGSRSPDLGPIIADMGDRNLRSVTDGRLNLADIDDVSHWFLPYDGPGGDDHMADRYLELATLPPGTLGYEFWAFYDRHGFALPGRPGAVNELFGTPHDCTHLLSGYDTSPQGELLVSTFTGRMHPIFPMDGHILPVIYSWHIGIEFNKLAGSYCGALDPAKFWVAWDRGLRTSGDTFAHDFDLWEHASDSLEHLRQAFGVPPLDPEHAAHSTAVAGVDYNPIA